VNHTAGRTIAEAHAIEIDARSRLRRFMGLTSRTTVPVNSSHHQAVGILGDGLVRAAWSPEDGIVEAAEGHGDQFLIGVQWHPERTFEANRCAQGLFQAFVDAAAVWEPRMIRESVAD
jgi:putative glutamine amidotransferase